jgi:hypothetical protein
MIYQAENLPFEKLSIGDRVDNLKQSEVNNLLFKLRQKYPEVRFITFNYTKDGYVNISILGN